MARRSYGGGGGGAGVGVGRTRLECFSCGQPHHSSDCPDKLNRSGRPGVGPAHHAGGGMRNSLAPQMPNVTLPTINMGHTPLDAQKRIKQLLIMMTPDEQSIIRMAQSLIEDIRAHNLGAFVGQTLLHCVKCLPQKSMMLVGLFASLRNQSRQQGDQDDKLARAFLDELAVEFDIACKQSRWAELRLLLRFTVGLGQANVVELSTIWSIIEKVRSWIDMDDLPSSKREYLLHTLLTLVPFLVSSPDQPSTEFDKFNALKKDLAECVRKLPTTELLNVRISKDRSIAPSTLPSDSYSNLPFSFSLLSCWVSSLQDLATPIEFLHDPSEVSVQRACYLAFKNSKIPPISWHGADHLSLPATAPPRLRPIFRLFPRSPSSQSSSPSSSAHVFPLNDLLVGEYISDILIAFEALHKEGVKQLLSLPLPLSDDARTIGQYLVIETIFEAMLTLPTSSVKQVYYGTIIIDLFKAQPNLMPPLLGAGFNFLFHHLQFLDREIIERLLDWFSFHLSNFGYAWPWVSWNYVLEQSDSNPQRSFVREALGLCVRLSYWERIQQVIPEEFLVLMPPQPSPAFRFSTKNIQNTSNGDLNIQQYYQFSLELIAIMNGKATSNAIIQWLDQNVAPALGSEARVRLFTPCLLECGNKSYSHSIALLDRYKSVFQTLTTTTTKRKTNAKEDEPSDESPQLMPAFDVQRLILHSIAEYWQHSLQHLIVLLDQFFIYNILTIDSLLGWCFFSHRHAHNYTHLWQPIFYPHLRISLDKFTSELDLIREKPRAMTLTQEKRIEDEAKMEEIKLEQRDLISMVISNFQKLYQEEVNQSNRATREKDKQRYEFEQANVIARFKQFVRKFASYLAPHVHHLLSVCLPPKSPLADLVGQIPLLL